MHLKRATLLTAVALLAMSTIVVAQPNATSTSPLIVATVHRTQVRSNINATLLTSSPTGGLYRISVDMFQVLPPTNCTDESCGEMNVYFDWVDDAGAHEKNVGMLFSNCPVCDPVDAVRIIRMNPNSMLVYRTAESANGTYDLSVVVEQLSQ